MRRSGGACFTVATPVRLQSVASSIGSRRRSAVTPRASLVVVAGATGGVGRLVVERLLAMARGDATTLHATGAGDAINRLQVTRVRALTRDAERARQLLPGDADGLLEIAEVGFESAAAPGKGGVEGEAGLRAFVGDANALVICTGTTAFPTRAWRNGNTPRAVADVGVRDLTEGLFPETKSESESGSMTSLRSAPSSVDARVGDDDSEPDGRGKGHLGQGHVKRIVLVSSIGTERTEQMPFRLLNLFGMFDAKRAGEEHVRAAARRLRCAYAIVRPGRLIGAPHSNIGMVQKEPSADALNVEVGRGDVLGGDLSRAATADAVVLATTWNTQVNLDFSAVHCEGAAPTADRWHSLFDGVQGNAVVQNQVDTGV